MVAQVDDELSIASSVGVHQLINDVEAACPVHHLVPADQVEVTKMGLAAFNLVMLYHQRYIKCKCWPIQARGCCKHAQWCLTCVDCSVCFVMVGLTGTSHQFLSSLRYLRSRPDASSCLDAPQFCHCGTHGS